MKTYIDVLDNPNQEPAIQNQLVKCAIASHERSIRQWRASPKRDTRAVLAMIAEYQKRLDTLKGTVSL